MPPALPYLIAAGDSDQGHVRSNNEDRIYIDEQRGIFLVVDGMGGQAAGEEAAEIAVQTVRARLEKQTDSADQRIREAIALANNAIYEAAERKPAWRGMACVLTLVVLEGSQAIAGHVGDSRLYLIHPGKIEKITRDHSPVGEREDAGELTEEAARNHPRRNEVYRDVGSALRTPDDHDFIEIQRFTFTPESAMLLCSDGLSDVLSSQRILQLVEAHAGNCRAAVEKLIAEAVVDGKDNVSVVLVEGEKFAQTETAAVPVPPVRVEEPTRANKSHFALWAGVALLLGAIAILGVWRWFAVPPSAAHGPRTVRVGPGADIPSIPEAVSNAEPNDILELTPGEYREKVLLRSGLSIRSLEAGKAVLTGGIIAEDVEHATLTGITVREVGIYIRNAKVEISRIDVSEVSGPGIEYAGNSTGTLRDSRIHNNSGPGILLRDTASPLIENNFISANGKAQGHLQPGIAFLSTGAPHISSNGIGDNGAEPFWFVTTPPPELLHSNVLSDPKHMFRLIPAGATP